MTAKRYDDAVRAASDALKLYPSDPTAAGILKEAQDDKARGDADAKRKAAYTADIQSARAAIAAKRYDDAIKAANDALKLFPGDPTATAILREAQDDKARGDVEAKRRADYAADLQAARTAITARRYDDAIKAAGDALKVVPGDPTATQILKDAQAGKAATDVEAKRRADYAAAMALAQQAMAAKRYPDAVKAFTEALRLVRRCQVPRQAPAPTAGTGLQQVDAKRRGVRAAENVGRRLRSIPRGPQGETGRCQSHVRNRHC